MTHPRQLLPLDLPTPPIWGEHGSQSDLDVIVFSKDRANQLDALLRSMRAFFPLPHRLHIIYTSSNGEFERAYDLLRRWHQGINWVEDRGPVRLDHEETDCEDRRGPGALPYVPR